MAWIQGIGFDPDAVFPIGTQVVIRNFVDNDEFPGVVVGIDIPCDFEIEDYIKKGVIQPRYKVLTEFSAEWEPGHVVFKAS